MFETLISKETRNDLEIVSTYLFNSRNPRLKLIPEEQLSKLKNPEEIKEKLLTNECVAKACVEFGDKDKIPEDILTNVKFIENINGFLDKIVDRIPKDNIENLIEIYKASPDHVLFEDSDLEYNREFIFKIAEIDIDNYMEEELDNYNNHNYKRVIKKFPKTKEDFRDEAEKHCGVANFANELLLKDPAFMSEAINRRIDGLNNQNPYFSNEKYSVINSHLQYNQDYIMDIAIGIDKEKVDIEQLPDVLKKAMEGPNFWFKKIEKEEREEEETNRNEREVKEVTLEQLMKENEELKERIAKVEALLGINKDEQAKEEQ